MVRPVFIKVRLYPGRDDDLLAWYTSLRHMPYGSKSQAIKEALRRGLQGSNASAPAAMGALDTDTVREAVATAMAQSLDLAAVRRVVEAAVLSALTAARVSVVEEDVDKEEDDTTLDNLGQELLM